MVHNYCKKKICGYSSIPAPLSFLLLFSTTNHRCMDPRLGFQHSQALLRFQHYKNINFSVIYLCCPSNPPERLENSPELRQGHHQRARSCLIDLCWQRWEDFCYPPAASFQEHTAYPAKSTTKVKVVEQEHQETPKLEEDIQLKPTVPAEARYILAQAGSDSRTGHSVQLLKQRVFIMFLQGFHTALLVSK